jgi:hypothetical protein
MKRLVVSSLIIVAVVAAVVTVAVAAQRSGRGAVPGIMAVKAAHEAALMAVPDVLGVGVGERQGKPVIEVYLRRVSVAVGGAIPTRIQGYAVVTSVAGAIVTLPDQPASSPPGAPGAVGGSPGPGAGSGTGGAVPPVNPGGPMKPVPPIIPVRPVSPPMQAGRPDACGVVSGLDITAAGTPGGPGGAMLVSGSQASGVGYDKAMVRFGPATRILERTSSGLSQVSPDSLKNGRTVAVWFTGAVAESYPVQAQARLIVILP